MSDTRHVNVRLRHLLVQVLDDLTDLDRSTMHFLLGEDVPRRLREHHRPKHTLRLFDYLIDSEKVFELLPDALERCGKVHWARQLKGKSPA